MQVRTLLSRLVLSLLAVCAAPVAAAVPLDSLVIRNGMAVPETPYNASDAGPTLKSLGRWRDTSNDVDYTIWEVANPTKNPSRLRLEAMQDAFLVEVDVPGNRRAYLRSPVTAGNAEHRLLANQKVLAVVASSSLAWSDGTPISAATASNRAPVWYSTAPTIAQLAPPYRYAPIVFDADNEPVTFAVQQAPSGFAFVSGAGQFVWSATAAQLGPNAVVLRAIDARGSSADQSATVKLVSDFCPIHPISLPGSALAGIPVGQHFEKLARGSGSGNYQWLTWAGAVDSNALAQSLDPPGNSETYVDPDDAADRQLDIADWAQGASGSMNADNVKTRLTALLGRDITVPAYDQIRQTGSRFDYRTTRFVVIRLTDYNLTGNGWLSFDYRGETRCYNDVPSAVPQSLVTPEDTALPIVLTGADPESDVLAYTVHSQPAHGTLTGTAPNLIYAPAPNYNGPDSLTFSVNDGSFSSHAVAVSISVTPVNDPPTAEDRLATTPEDTSVPVVLAASDIDSASLSWIVASGPRHGTLTGAAPFLTYTPDAEFAGPDAFTYRALDGESESNLATVSILVTPVNDAPAAVGQSIAIVEDVSVPVTLSATDADGDALVYAVVTPPNHGALSGNPPSLTYTPAHDFNGSDALVFRVNDGTVDSNLATVTITIVPTNDAPSASGQNLTIAAGVSLPVVLSGADTDGDALRFVVDTQPQHGTLSGVAPNLVYVSTNGYAGPDVVTFHVEDLVSRSATAAINIVVTYANRPPVIVSTPTASGVEGSQYRYDVDAVDPDGDALVYGMDQAPTGAVITPTSGLITWSPNSPFIEGLERQNVMCRNELLNGPLVLAPKWHWTGSTAFPGARDVFGPPLVAPLVDTNADGRVDRADAPAVVFVASGGVGPLLVALDARTGNEIFATTAPNFTPWGSPAIADIDGDGVPEIVGITSFRTELVAVSNTGQVRWRRPAGPPFGSNGDPHPRDVILIADLDADGRSEIINGNRVYDSYGQLRWAGAQDAGGYLTYATAPIAADIDGDGKQELIAGRTTYRANGTVLWHSSSAYADGFNAIGNFDADPEPEIVLVGSGAVSLLNHDGTVKWQVFIGDPGQGGPPTVADVNGDGVPEIGVASHSKYVVYRANGSVLWSATVQDFSSNRTGSTSFDFDNDGRAEILYADELNLHVYDGPTGAEKLTMPMGSGTVLEYPVVADADQDGSADILVASNSVGNSERDGVWMFSSPTKSWAPTRSIWNQHAYSIDNVTDDGRIPAIPGKSWLTHNTYRLNKYIGQSPIGQVDLALFDVALTHGQNGRTLSVKARNRGLATSAPTAVRFQDGGPGAAALGEVTIPALAPNDSTTAAVAIPSDMVLGDRVIATIDPDASQAECDEANNDAVAALVAVRATDPAGLYDRQTYLVSAKPINHPPSISTTALPSANVVGTDYRARIEASDADRGDGLRYELVAPLAGMSIGDRTGNFHWLATSAQVGSRTVTARVTDLSGASASKSFTVLVKANQLPVIVSQPVVTLAFGATYVYDVTASDADGDVLVYSLDVAPEGMAIVQASGVVTWQPLWVPVSAVPVTVRASDSHGGSVVQTFAVTVSQMPGNHDPVFQSVTPTLAAPGSTFAYQSSATDADADTLSYSLTGEPLGMHVANASGLVSWEVPSNFVGPVSATIHVVDGRGGHAQQSLQLKAPGTGSNVAPVIVSTPVTAAIAGTSYAYSVVATDTDGDTISFQLLASPSGMAIDAQSGRIQWTPTANQLGIQVVDVRATDARGAYAGQTYTIAVSPASNSAPRISTAPPPTAKARIEYRYDVDATDSDGDTLVFTLVSAPAGMSIDAPTGLIRWTPPAASGVSVTVRVSDGQAYEEQAWTILVLDSSVQLAAQLVLDPTNIAPDAPVGATLAVSGAAGQVVATSTLDGVPITLMVNGTTALTTHALGRHTVSTSVTDGFDTVTASADFFVSDGSDTSAPEVHLTTPGDNAEITKPTAVRGSVQDANLASWVLAYRESNTPDGALTTLAQGTTNVPESALATFDPTMLLNGQYSLILQATDTSGRTAFDSVVLRVTDDMKIGNYSITFEDVNIPLSGIPIRVTRTYDTRQRNQALDFGYGWSVDYQNVRVRESQAPGYSWQLVTINQGGFETHCVQPNGDRVVTVTLPDGKVESFRARGDQNCAQFQIPELVFLQFEPIDGTDSTLEQTDFGPLMVAEVAGTGVSHLIDPGNPGVPVDPRHYRLTTPEGVVYDLDQFLGVQKVTEPSGNTLTYSNAGVVHSSGVGVQFVRDPATNRITEIVLPDGKVLSYGYTPAGDLDLMADQLLQTTRYAYEPRAATNPKFKHYLRDIIDARGIRVSRNEYLDEQGCTTNPADACVPTRALRLWKTIDADGKEIVYTHDVAGQVEQVRDRRGYLKTFEYDDSGRVLSETNALNETTLHSYDPDGNELTRTDPLGHTTASAYDVRGNKVAEVGPTGQRTEMEYDGRNALTVQRECLNPVAVPVAGVGASPPTSACMNARAVIRNTYRPETGVLTSTKDALGHETRFTYDSGAGSGQTGELTDTYDALNQRTHYDIDYRGWRTSETNALGHVTSYTHDANGRVRTETRTRTVYPVGATPGTNGTAQTLVTTTTYDDKGRATRTDHPDGSYNTVQYNAIDKPELECDALNHCTRHDYDAQGREWKTTFADGTFETKVYDPEGNVIAQTDRGGRTTKMVYDAAGRQTETIYPDASGDDGNDANNPRSINHYDAAGRLDASSDPNGHTTTYGYDHAGRRTTVTDALNHTSTTHYDSTGRRSDTVDALGRTTTFVYDDAGRMTSTVFDDQTTTGTTFDALGRKVAETDQEGRITRYGYDALGRLAAVFLPDPATGSNPALVNGSSPDPNVLVTRYGYDEAGNKLSQTDAEGRTTRWTYDQAGRELSRTLPLGQSESFGYDIAGNRDTHTDFNGKTTTYTYDDINRLKTTTFPDGEGTRTITYTPNGQRDHVTDQSGTTSYRYDARDRLTRVTDANGRAIEYQYDDAGNRTAVITASQSHAYGYDELNRLETVTSTVGTGPATITRYEYDDVGNRKAMVHGNGTRTEYGYSRLNRLKTLVHKTAAGALMLGLGYTLDASGMRTAIDETDAQTGTRNTTYQYDEVKRLTGESVIASDAALNRNTTWVYDSVGNRLTQTHTAGAAPAAVTTYGYDANDRLQSESGATTSAYVYDPNGNTLSRTGGGNSAIYRYTSENRLAESSTGDVTVAYRYNADGIRTRKIEAAPGETSTTDYLIDPNQSYAQVVEEWRGSNAGAPVLVAAYVLGDERLSQTRCAANTQGTPIGECQGAEVSYFHADGLGSVRLLSDGAGAITDLYAYEAFGALDEAASSGGTSNEFRYTGEQFDPDLGFYYLRARYLDPRAERFASKDAWPGQGQNPASLNSYSYVRNNPALLTDPSGYCDTEFDEIGTPGFGRAVEREVDAQYSLTHPWNLVEYGKCQWTGVRYLKPDIFNFTLKLMNEIKPLSPNGIAEGFAQMGAYILAFGPGGVFLDADFSPDPSWNAFPAPVNGVPTFFVNVSGIIFYTDDGELAAAAAFATSQAMLRDSLRQAKRRDTMVGLDAAGNAIRNFGRAAVLGAVAIGTITLVSQVQIAQLSKF